MSRKQLSRSGGDLSRLGTDDTGADMLHLDMDSFFVSVELLSRPELIGRPVIVGGRSGARRRGLGQLRSPRVRCPRGHAHVPGDESVPLRRGDPHHRTGLYSEYSRQVFDLVAEVTPDVRQVSVDEAYVDVSGAVLRLGSPVAITTELRAKIKERTGLAASVGIAGSQVVAKLASARAKPDGQLLVPLAATQEFLDPMPIEALPGVGEKTQQGFARYGIRLIGDLADVDEAWAARVFGAHGHQLWRAAHGQDSSGFDRQAKDHSISAEHTFDEDIWDLDVLEHEPSAPDRQGRLPSPGRGQRSRRRWD
jgi:DNA polymerase-4